MDLEALTRVSFCRVERSLKRLESQSKIVVNQPFALTPDKGYTARLTVNAEINGKPFGSGNIVLVVFQPGDGTGNAQDYQIGSLEARHTPRKKQGAAELYISVGTFFNGLWVPGLNCLSCWGLDSRGNILGYKELGSSAAGFESNLKAFGERKGSPYPFSCYDFTFDSNPSYHRPNSLIPYGNPHAVLWPSSLQIEHTGEFFQVGAFLNFPEETETLERIRKIIKG